MEHLSDPVWMKHLALGKPIERFSHKGLSVLALRMPLTPKTTDVQYIFRVFFFERDDPKPVLSVDLEESILGDFCVSIRKGSDHHLASHLETLPDWDAFRAIAIGLSDRYIEH